MSKKMYPPDRRSGQALLAVTLSFVVIIGLLSLTINIAWGYYQREGAQSAADAAAAGATRYAINKSPSSMTCGTSGVWCGTPAGTATNCPATAPTTASTSFDSACMMAAANGFTTSGSKTVTVQANTSGTPPGNSSVSANYWVLVTVSQNETGLFSPPNGQTALRASARATGAVTNSTSTTTTVSGTCIYLLDKTMSGALNMSNSALLTTNNCGVYVNSSSSTAVTATGSATLRTASLNIVGKSQGYSASNSGTLCSTSDSGCTNGSGKVSTGFIQTGVTAIADPFSGLTAPTVAATCTSGNFSAWKSTPYALSPGTYCNFSTGASMSYVLSTGIYVIKGGQFSLSSGCTLTASGPVLIYLVGSGASVSISNGGSMTLSAYTSGNYEGVLFWQDKSVTTAAVFNGGTNTNLTGSLYFPTANVTLNNGSSASVTGIVADSMTLAGGNSTSITKASSISQTGLSQTATTSSYAAQIVQ